MTRRPQDRDDRELLVGARRSADDFAVLYDRHAAAVVRHFRRRGLSAEQALDLTSETFASALASIDRYRPGPEPGVAWLYGIARNLLADGARRGRIEDAARRRLGLPRLVVTDAGIARIEELTAGPDADDPLALALASLPATHRDAVVARVVDDREYADIAAELRCSEHLVRQRVSRGLRGLREALQGERP